MSAAELEWQSVPGRVLLALTVCDGLAQVHVAVRSAAACVELAQGECTPQMQVAVQVEQESLLVVHFALN